MPDPSHIVYARATRNQRLPCGVPGCPRRRTFTAALCSPHQTRIQYLGHPKAKVIKREELRPFRKVARRFLKKWAGHPATVAAIEVVGAILKPGPEPTAKPLRANPRWLTWREVTRLATDRDKGPVSPAEALEVAIAVWLLAVHQPRALPNDGRPLTFALAHHLFRLRPLFEYVRWDNARGKNVKSHHRAPGTQALTYFGQRVRTALGVWFTNAVQAIGQEERRRQEKALKLKQALQQKYAPQP